MEQGVGGGVEQGVTGDGQDEPHMPRVPADAGEVLADAGETVDGGEAVCYAALVCPNCGAVMGDQHPAAPCGAGA